MIAVSAVACATRPPQLLIATREAADELFTGCELLSAEEVLSPPPTSQRQNVCFTGRIYADSEYFYIDVPPESASSPKVGVDGAVRIPRWVDRRSLNGLLVWVVGDIEYDADCWAPSDPPEESEVICLPIQRPIKHRRGYWVVVPGGVR